jgi:hypothetical protein
LGPAYDLTPEVLKRPQLRYLNVQNAAKDASFTAALTNLASASRSSQEAKAAAVTTEQYTIYQLANSGRWFKAALKNQETRKWIEEVVETGEDVYVVVDYQTMVDVTVLGDMVKSEKLPGPTPAASIWGSVGSRCCDSDWRPSRPGSRYTRPGG